MLNLRPINGSSSVVAAGRDGDHLVVLFRGSQRAYRYIGAGAELDALLSSRSKGTFINEVVKSSYSFEPYVGQVKVSTQVSLRELLPGPSYGF